MQTASVSLHNAKIAVDKHKAKKGELKDFQDPVRFSWLLAPSQREEVKKARQELQAEEKKTISTVAAAGAAPKGEKLDGGSSSSSAAPAAKKAKTTAGRRFSDVRSVSIAVVLARLLLTGMFFQNGGLEESMFGR